MDEDYDRSSYYTNRTERITITLNLHKWCWVGSMAKVPGSEVEESI
jgi:hypothetical protein